MTPIPCPNEFPFRLEITEFDDEPNTERLYFKTEQELKERFSTVNTDVSYASGWNRLSMDLLMSTHTEL